MLSRCSQCKACWWSVVTRGGQGDRLWGSIGGGRPVKLCILRCLKGRSDLSFENDLLVCLGRTDEGSAGQGGQKKGTKK